MSKRIRYFNERTDTNSLLVSAKTFNVGSVEYKVFLNTIDMTFDVKNAVTGEVASHGTGKSESNLKLKAKKALVVLGYVFEGETRNSSDEAEDTAA